MGNPLVSVVVPVYNVEDYLGECLDSLIAQTYDAIEIICVNDGSTDGSLAVAQGYARDDARVVIVDKPNGGLSSARNAGIQAARGAYVCFVDSDDYVMPELCETVAAAFMGTGADIVTYGAHPVPLEAAQQWLIDTLSPRDAVYDAFTLDLLFKESSHPYSWRTAFAVDFLRTNGLLFDETVRFGEDEVFDFIVYPRSRKTVLLSDKLYCYRCQRTGSLMATMEMNQALKMSEHVNIAGAIFADWAEQGILARYEAEMLRWITQFVMVDALFLDQDGYRSVVEKLRAMLERYWTRERIEQIDVVPFSKQVLLKGVFTTALPALGARKRLAYDLISGLWGRPAADNDPRLADMGWYRNVTRAKNKARRILRG